jgi:hypothetical protein
MALKIVIALTRPMPGIWSRKGLSSDQGMQTLNCTRAAFTSGIWPARGLGLIHFGGGSNVRDSYGE